MALECTIKKAVTGLDTIITSAAKDLPIAYGLNN